jgi:guanosine-3',5'-bis(diphosphate) 3'-pyrophosphohydrolase
VSIRSFAAELLLPSSLQSRGRNPPAAPVGASARPDTASFASLSSRLGYLNKAEHKLVLDAYRFADEAHLGQFRASGAPYITHPLAVASLVADWHLDAQAVMAALLHDAMEDCGVTKPALIERFGAPTAELVDGLTKLDKLQFPTREEGQAESFRKMLLAMARDVRVILVKLADRLHNMRTLGAMPADKRSRIARETLDIYAPIAHRLGLNLIYRELQELSFEHLYPWRHAALAKAVRRARGTRRDIVERVRADVERAFAAAKIKVQISGREKTVYSIYRKMREKHAGFAEVNDIFGFRIVVGSLLECYQALGVLHQLYKPLPGRFKDYIAIPKPNGYQSLHTTLVSPLGTPVEFQIRTEAMHAVADTGIAAHWLYKHDHKRDGQSALDAQRLGAMWLKSLLEIEDDNRDSAEFLEHVKIDLVPEEVYIFTPMSKIVSLPRGATPLDFAYAIHSDVGDHCVAAKVNGEPVALRSELRSGDVVEILTDEAAHPNPAWLSYVRTGRARSKIRHYLKNLAQDESLALGEKLLVQALRAEGMQLPSSDPADAQAQSIWQQVVRFVGSRSRADLLVDIGLGRKIATIVARRMAQLMAERGMRPDAVTMTLGRLAAETHGRQVGVVIDGSEGASVQMATCCRPIPGDEIRGYLGRGEGLIVHTADCRNGRKLAERDPDRWMTLEWGEPPMRDFETAIRVEVRNEKGALAQVATAVSGAEADINHIDMDNLPLADVAELRLLVAVRDRLQLADVLRALKRSGPVIRAARVKP